MAPVHASGEPDFQPWSGTPEALDLPLLVGGQQKLAAHPGKVTLVHFFATWCGPCREELGFLAALKAQFAGEPLVVLGVDVGEPPVRIKRFFETVTFPWPVLIDEDKRAMKRWQVGTFPTSFLIGPDGRSGLKVEGDVQWTAPGNIARIEIALRETKKGPVARP